MTYTRRPHAGRSYRHESLRSLRQPCGHISSRNPAPIASSLPRRQPVVTMRSMPQPTRSYRRLAQVIPPSDGLPDPSSPRAIRSCPRARSQWAHFKSTPQRALLRAWVNGSSRCIDFPQEAPSMPMPRAAVASSRANGTNREWCPESLVDPDTHSVRDGQKH